MEGKLSYPEAVCVVDKREQDVWVIEPGKKRGARCLVFKDVPTRCFGTVLIGRYVVYSRKIFFTNKMCAVWHHTKQPKAERCSGPSLFPGPAPAVTKEQVYKRLLIMSFPHVVQSEGHHLGCILDFHPL